jgi:hypothetical protein
MLTGLFMVLSFGVRTNSLVFNILFRENTEHQLQQSSIHTSRHPDTLPCAVFSNKWAHIVRRAKAIPYFCISTKPVKTAR